MYRRTSDDIFRDVKRLQDHKCELGLSVQPDRDFAFFLASFKFCMGFHRFLVGQC